VATITVTQLTKGDPMEFDVEVRDGKGRTHHRVTMQAAIHARMAGTATPAALIRAAFAFLLERESKESILGRFDVTVISRYFPEFEQEIGKYLRTVS
jgi:hypothetical protein